MGLTTGQAARYCLVSPDTIVKWIKAENLPAQRTIGGQFRIFVEDLRQFMIRNDMSTALLDVELECRPYCWECQHGAHREAGTPGAPCSDCLVYRTKALNCHELRAVSAGQAWRRADCRDCPYYRNQAKQRSEE
jgi:excisionase family DNA binding protein